MGKHLQKAIRSTMTENQDLTHDIPFLNFIGAQLTSWSDGHATVSLPLGLHHLNRSGIVHGGLYCVLMDAAGGLAGCYGNGPSEQVRALTLSLTTSFVGRASSGTLSARATVRKKGSRIYFSTIEVHTDQQELVAMGEGTFRITGAPRS